LVGLAFRAEAGISKAYRARRGTATGAARSLDRVLSGVGGPAPEVRAFADPSARALVVRSLGSPGLILLSEGLLGVLTEEELRQLLRESVSRLRSRGMVLQGVCAWLAHGALSCAPRGWVELLFGKLRWQERLNPLSAICFLLVLAAARFFVALGRAPTGEWDDAPRAYSRLSGWSGEVSNPGSCVLHLVDPWQSRLAAF
jgi:hypothetical protein